MADVPKFNDEGLLPVGDYTLTIDELAQSKLVWSHGEFPHWDESWRLYLVKQLAELVDQLEQVGIFEVFVDGSFVEAKPHPNDIDGYFVCDRELLVTGELERQLNELDPHQTWTWDHSRRTPYRDYKKPQLPMWHRYRVELYPHFAGMGCGIFDEHGNEMEFPAAFRTQRFTFKPKGIVKIIGEDRA